MVIAAIADKGNSSDHDCGQWWSSERERRHHKRTSVRARHHHNNILRSWQQKLTFDRTMAAMAAMAERERCQATEERERPLQWKRDWGGTKRAWGHKKWNILITKTKAYLLWQNKSFNSFVSLCWCSICTVLPRSYRVVTSPFYRGLNLLLTGLESVKKNLPVITR